MHPLVKIKQENNHFGPWMCQTMLVLGIIPKFIEIANTSPVQLLLVI